LARAKSRKCKSNERVVTRSASFGHDRRGKREKNKNNGGFRTIIYICFRNQGPEGHVPNGPRGKEKTWCVGGGEGVYNSG